MPRIYIQPRLTDFAAYREYASKHGYDYELIEFADPQAITSAKSLLHAYQACLQGSDKHLSLHAPYIDIYINSPDAAIRRVSQQRIVRSLEQARELQAEYVIFHTNHLPCVPNQEYTRNWVEAHVSFWGTMTKKYNMTLLLENMWDKDPGLLCEVVEKVGSERFKVCFDTGHCNVFSQVNMNEWFAALGRYIVYIHLSDNFGDTDSSLPPGRGNIDWKEFGRLVKEYCDEPHVMIGMGLGGLNAIQEAIAYLEKHKIYPCL